MAIKPRHDYEVVGTDVTLSEDHQSAIVLIDTAGPIDLGLRLSRDTLALLRTQIDSALSDPTPRAGQQ
jgi:hypothetical protein